MEKWFYEMYGIPYSLFKHNIYYKDKLRYEIFVVSEIEKIQDYSTFTMQLSQSLQLPPVTILQNSLNESFSRFQDNWYIVVVGENQPMKLTQIQAIHELGKQETFSISISEMMERWLERLMHIEENILPTLPSLVKYEDLLINIYMAVSVGESAIHYLRYIAQETLPGCLTHARLSFLDSFYVLNPLYFKIDHECRDFVELYNAKRIEKEEFLRLIEGYTRDELLYAVARLIYPTLFFDYLEELFISQQWELKYTYDLEADLQRKSELAISIMKSFELPNIDYLFSFLP